MSNAATAHATSPSIVDEFLVIVQEQLVTAFETLFETYGEPLTLERAEAQTQASQDLSLGSVIGFTSRHVRGVLAIAIDSDLAIRMNPISATANTPDAATDWIGELANQLLGRLKNKLLSVGVELELSTPLIVEGNHLRMGVDPSRAMHFFFTHDSNQAQVWWDAEIDPDLVLGEADEEVQEEGEMLLF